MKFQPTTAQPRLWRTGTFHTQALARAAQAMVPAHRAAQGLHGWFILADMHTDLSADRRRLLLGGLGATLLTATGCSKSAPKGRTLTKDATLLCLGDSLTFGYGAPTGTTYPHWLEQLTDHVTQNAGLNGDTSEGALARLPDLLRANTPGLVLVSIGGNDFLRKWPLERSRTALSQLVKTAAATTQVALIAQPRPELMAAALGSLKDHPVYAEVAGETGVPLFEGGWSHVLSRADLRSARACSRYLYKCERGENSANLGARRHPDRASGLGVQQRVALFSPRSLRVAAKKPMRSVAKPCRAPARLRFAPRA